MAIKSSGILYMSDFHAEFGLGYSFNSYRGKGGVPGSGTIYFSQLYGASNIVREPASGESYAPARGSLGGGGTGWFERSDANPQIYWNNTFIGFAGGTQWTSGNWTYYRGSLREQGSGGGSENRYTSYGYGIYRVGRY